MGLTNDPIVNWTRKRFPKKENWLTGNCYFFALMLKERFDGEIIYDFTNDHCLLKTGTKCYDWQGPHDLPKHWLAFEEMKVTDPGWYMECMSRLVE